MMRDGFAEFSQGFRRALQVWSDPVETGRVGSADDRADTGGEPLDRIDGVLRRKMMLGLSATVTVGGSSLASAKPVQAEGAQDRGRQGPLTSERPMIASSRFVMPGDWSTGSAEFRSDQDVERIQGGQGEVVARSWHRRFAFYTASWGRPIMAGRFLFENAAMSTLGVRSGRYPLELRRAELRSASGDRIESLTFGGGARRILQPNVFDFVWSDPLEAQLPPQTGYLLDLYYACPDGASFPAIASRYLNGECSASSPDRDLSLEDPDPAAIEERLRGHFGPSLFVAQNCPPDRPTAYLIGTSIADFAAFGAAFSSPRGVSGFIQYGLDDEVGGGPWAAGSAARYSSAMRSVFEDVASSGPDEPLGARRSLLSHLGETFKALHPTLPPFNLLISEHGRNHIGSDVSQIRSRAVEMYGAVHQLWPDIPIFQTTTPPSTNAAAPPANDTAWTTEGDQTPGANNDVRGVWADWTAWVRAGCDGWAQPIDTAAPMRRSPKWREDAWTAQLLEPLHKGLDLRRAVVRLSSDPGFGATLVFEPGRPQAGDGGLDYLGSYNVVSAKPHLAGGFEVMLRPAARTPSY